MRLEEADPKGLVRESYRIEGITLGECRSIFVDWALSLPVDAPMKDALRALIPAPLELAAWLSQAVPRLSKDITEGQAPVSAPVMRMIG